MKPHLVTNFGNHLYREEGRHIKFGLSQKIRVILALYLQTRQGQGVLEGNICKKTKVRGKATFSLDSTNPEGYWVLLRALSIWLLLPTPKVLLSKCSNQKFEKSFP